METLNAREFIENKIKKEKEISWLECVEKGVWMNNGVCTSAIAIPLNYIFAII